MDEADNSAWHRSPAVGAATLFLFAGGVLAVLAGGTNFVFAYLWATSPGSFTGIAPGFDRLFALFAGVATVFLLFGMLQFVAGLLVLRRQERGRRLGILAAVVGVILGILYITNFGGASAIAILIYGSMALILITNRQLFLDTKRQG